MQPNKPKVLRNPHMGQPPLSPSPCHGAPLAWTVFHNTTVAGAILCPNLAQMRGRGKFFIKLICSLICKIFYNEFFMEVGGMTIMAIIAKW
jgi:hypothetical protein